MSTITYTQSSFVVDRLVPREVTKPARLLVRELPAGEQPVNRLRTYGTRVISAAELVAAVIQTPDALSLAQELLTHFGTLAELAQASIAQLCEFEGIGPAKACQIKAAFEMGRRSLDTDPSEPYVITSPADMASKVQWEMGQLEQEHLVVALLNTKSHLLDLVTVYVGNVNSVMIRRCEVFKEAVKRNVTAVIVLHNHPSQDPSPSPEDVAITRQLIEAGKLLGIEVLDHLIVCKHRWVSLKERGLAFS